MILGVQRQIRLLIWSMMILAGFSAQAQSYGLTFASNEVMQDNRTALDLTPKEPVCLKRNAELSFDIAFLPNRTEYFGYILRVIDQNRRNIDVLCDNIVGSRACFSLVVGNVSTSLVLKIDSASFFNRWHKFKIKFNFYDSQIIMTLGKTSVRQQINNKKAGCFKFLLGANNYGEFKTTDVPPVKLKNLQLYEEGQLKYKWPLNQTEGNDVKEDISSKNGEVKNPLWIKKMHYEWKLLKKTAIEGPVSSAFNPKKEVVYIVGRDSLYTFSVANESINGLAYQSGSINLLRGNQSYYNEKDQHLYSFYPDQKKVIAFDFKTHSWDGDFDADVPVTDNWHFNEVYSSADHSFYIFNGYGHFIYKNTITKIDLSDRKWHSIQPSNQVYAPRYLSALGSTDNGIYILGGYGSNSGQQILNPKHLYNLLYFDKKNKSVREIYKLKVPAEDFVFANSMVINQKLRSYYALIFPKHIFNSKLKLITGSLDSADFQVVGDTIPFKFHDVKSFADLYYCPVSQKFVAITEYLNDKNQTEIALYALAFPPLAALKRQTVRAHSKWFYYGVFVFMFVLINCGVAIYLRKKKRWVLAHKEDDKLASVDSLQSLISDPLNENEIDIGVKRKNNEQGFSYARKEMNSPKDSIFIFGGMQIFDIDQNDITKYFTPLIKELFLVILLYTIRYDRGISSEKLKKLLWFDKTDESARNNRSVNIAKLKNILEKMKYCQVSRETGYWCIDIDYSKIYVDYYHYLNIIRDKGKLNKEKIRELAEIIERGSFLSNLEYEWLDPFKSEISNEIIDTFLHFTGNIEISEDPEFLIKIASYIFYFDPVNEEAMILKCKSLVYLGKHSLAKTSFENFKKEYQILYGEEFTEDFHSVLG